MDNPPNPGDFMLLPAGGQLDLQTACERDYTSYGKNISDPKNPNYPCPFQPMSEFHTLGPDNVKGCAMGIAYKSDIKEVKPEDITIFSVNTKCVLHLHTIYDIPKAMPPCPKDGCICTHNWIHSERSGTNQSGFSTNGLFESAG